MLELSTKNGVVSRMKKLLFCVVITLLLAGCATTQPMSQQDRARIKAVAIDGKVQKPNQMSYLGPSGGVGLMFGAIGGAAVAGSQMSAGQALQMHAEKNNINIENIITNELAAEIKASGKFPITETGNPRDATLKITIKQYGFSIPNGFSSKLVPTLSFSCELLDEKGKQIFTAGDSIMPLGNPVDGVSVEELKDPLVIQRLWKAAAQSIAKKIISQL